jgi:hypothetical protein
VHHQPLVVPAHQVPGPLEQLPVVLGVLGVVEGPFHDRVVEPQEGDVELGHDQVLVVASVAEEGDRPVLGPLGLAVAGQVAQVVAQGRDVVAGNAVALGDRGQPQLDAVVHVGRGGLRVALEGGAVAVHRVQVQGRPAQVAQVLDDRRRLQGPEVVDGDVGDGVLPVGVGRDVVVDELAPVGVHGRDGGVPDRL